MNKWWGYIHINGSIQVKQYFDVQDTQEVEDREDAIRQIKSKRG